MNSSEKRHKQQWQTYWTSTFWLRLDVSYVGYIHFQKHTLKPLLQSALNDLRKLLLKKGYPRDIINYHINDVLNKNRHQLSNPVSTVPKTDIVIQLPYLGLQSNQVAVNACNHVCTNSTLVPVNLKIIFQNTRCIKSLFPYKDRINRSQQSRIIYRANCWYCNGFYIGKTKRRLHDRKNEHFKALAPLDITSSGISLIF